MHEDGAWDVPLLPSAPVLAGSLFLPWMSQEIRIKINASTPALPSQKRPRAGHI